jgi:hypothetical protein
MEELINIIPKYEDSPISREELTEKYSKKANYSLEYSKGFVDSTIDLFMILGLFSVQGDRFKLSHQMPHYFLKTLQWYLTNDKVMFENWERSGTAKEIHLSNLHRKAPYLLKILEEKRYHLIKHNNLKETYSREQYCSIGLIKGTYKGKQYFLFQWDNCSERFQLIGGKRREKETPEETMIREINEEISQHELVYKKDYEINKILEKSIIQYEISRTYGALTRYVIDLFEVKMFLKDIKLDIIDRWISYEEILKGVTKSDKKDIAGSQLLSVIKENFPNGIGQFHNSFIIKKKLEIFEALELKPNFFGIGLDLKKL